MTSSKKIKVGIGFATGRKHFQKVLKSYIYNWKESGLVDNQNVSLNLFVAYDLNYNNTKKADYTPISTDIAELVDTKHFIGSGEVDEAKNFLVHSGILDLQEASRLFGKGYAAQRNIVLYSAIKYHMDYLLFLDDDEYPVAVTNTVDTAIWSGQHVLKTHLENIRHADITYGHHCGYISPIPYIEFEDQFREKDFRQFIEAISNDIVNWETIKKTMLDGGITYADKKVLASKQIIEVPEVNSAKFISGSNLCINLTDARRVFPFYNPPGARGEDTFLSTCLSDHKVLRVPCYTFHDGFSIYNHMLTGVLPTKLKFISPSSGQIVKRFYKACIGWVRYKPLLLYITDRDSYAERIEIMTENLKQTLPLICGYFGRQEFYDILKELEKYDQNVKKHDQEFRMVQDIWAKIMAHSQNIFSPEVHNRDFLPREKTAAEMQLRN